MSEINSSPDLSPDGLYYPIEENLGKMCRYWFNLQCGFPKAEMQGRTSCNGRVDDVCLELKDGRAAVSLTNEQSRLLRTRIPTGADNEDIPPGLFI